MNSAEDNTSKSLAVAHTHTHTHTYTIETHTNAHSCVLVRVVCSFESMYEATAPCHHVHAS